MDSKDSEKSQKIATAAAVVIAVAVIALFLGGLVYKEDSGNAPSTTDTTGTLNQLTQSSDQTTASSSPSTMSDTTSNDGQLQITDEVIGTGPAAKAGDHVYVNYIGTLTDGTKFDSSYDRGQPIDFQLGVGYVIKGWDEGLVGMKVGGKRKLVIPPSLGYGANAVGSIPANSTLIFEVELVKIGQ